MPSKSKLKKVKAFLWPLAFRCMNGCDTFTPFSFIIKTYVHQETIVVKQNLPICGLVNISIECLITKEYVSVLSFYR
jgi:hypothetical protein